jgi:hypothetical protein
MVSSQVKISVIGKLCVLKINTGWVCCLGGRNSFFVVDKMVLKSEMVAKKILN